MGVVICCGLSDNKIYLCRWQGERMLADGISINIKKVVIGHKHSSNPVYQ